MNVSERKDEIRAAVGSNRVFVGGELTDNSLAIISWIGG
jgi:hypothetical protein